MAVEQDRLLSLIEFAQQSARLRGTPVSTLSQHGLPVVQEHQIQGLPGVALNLGENGDDEIWLSIARRHETTPPKIKSALLAPWVAMTQGLEEPKLKAVTDGASLIAAGTHRHAGKAFLSNEERRLPEIDPGSTVLLNEYLRIAAVNAEFRIYLDNVWRPWSESEKLNRRTIRLYAEAFTLKQQLEGVIVEAQLELVWGVGIAIWSCNGAMVSYPLITRAVELSLNTETAAIEIRPRDVDARLEVDWYAAADNPGVADLEKAGKEFFEKATTTFSPFDRVTYEGLLRSAVTFLDAKGVYWPNQVPSEDRTLPQPGQNLKVTDTWVLFARPRTNSVYLQDLEKLKKRVASIDDPRQFPPAVAAVVTEPSTDNAPLSLPVFRGVSAAYHSESGDGSSSKPTQARDLYFPKAFNDEQVRIVQLLDVSDGVAVQGPPGTGKTHTIANIICHYLAQGKRVLVTSMKDPALAVLQGQLPSEIRPLAISLLTSEQEGMKQFEHAIQKIASEVQALDRPGMSREIVRLEETIEALHGRLALIDRRIAEWAKKNLSKITIDGEEIDPQDAARELVGQAGQFEWIPDAIGITAEFAPQFGDSDIARLREARRALGVDISYLGAALPQLAEFPDSKALLQAHQDLSQFEVLSGGIEAGDVPPLANSSQETISAAQLLLMHVEELRRLRDDVLKARRLWTAPIRERLRAPKRDDLFSMLDQLGAQLGACVEARKAFIERPVVVRPGLELDDAISDAIGNLTKGKSAFGLLGIVGKADQKKELQSIRVLSRAPSTPEDWEHVNEYLNLQKQLRALAVRWNALAQELGIEKLEGDQPEHGMAAAHLFALYRKVVAVVRSEAVIRETAALAFPSWPHTREVADSAQKLDELERALRHHLTKNRLANVWVVKERFQSVLDGKSGRIVDEIRRFLGGTLGNPSTPDADLQSAWSALMAELSRVLGLSQHLAAVEDVIEKIVSSGAPQYAAALKAPLSSAIDALLPDNWRTAWRLRRLETHLEAIDAQEELKKLAKMRQDVESDLARGYRDIVVKKTWLKLAENASPSIRAALQAYLNAIQRIGKGTGKRAVRYRHNAREAAAQANPAVPCWIMPHHRVSESLPAELGCFDLVIVDEASQSDLTALPALLRAEKVLIVGDDKQVSPEGVGLEEEKIRSLMARFLGNQVVTYRPQMSPDRSIYDLYKVVFAKSSVMLREHFRCVAPIIEYSKREHYNHELRPLRIPKGSERLDPPLIDVLIEDGHRNGDINLPEVRFIVDEIKKLVSEPTTRGRSIGVVSLIGDKQALKVWERLTEEIGHELIVQHQIACGDARTFQGKERDIMFLSMVSAPSNIGAPLSRDTFAQRFNVAASRARDRMYLVRSVGIENLSEADRIRRGLISHFATPFYQDEVRAEDLRKLCESPFERDVYDELAQRGYFITPQVKVGQYRIDLVVEGHNDARLAIECDGDKYHGADKWADDMQRQRTLERAGWVFWRCFASAFLRRRKAVVDDLVKTLGERGIEPIGSEGAPRSVHTEHRRVSTLAEKDYNPSAAIVAARMPPSNVSTPGGGSDVQPGRNRRLDRVLNLDLPALENYKGVLFGTPNAPTSSSQGDVDAVSNFCITNRLTVEDKRSKGGRLWVYHMVNDDEVAKQLRSWGFIFAPAKGFWHH
jgi:very-short-patch-repair endonuclease